MKVFLRFTIVQEICEGPVFHLLRKPPLVIINKRTTTFIPDFAD